MGLGILGELGFKEYRARISNRKFLNGVARLLNIPEDALYGMCMSLDKLEKIGREKVKKELVDVRGFEEGRAEDLLSLTAPDVFRAKNAVERVDELLKTVGKTEVGREGLEELRMIFDYLSSAGVDQSQYVFDPSLARGLAHYTGPIWEFEIIDGNIGSVGGCGRYDNIIGDYLGKGEQVPATGGSFGIERIVLVLKEQGLVDIDTAPSQVLVTLFGPDMLASSLEAATSLREAGIPALLYPDADSIGRQFKYADRKGIPWVVVIGPEEKEAGVVQLKNLQSGTQERMTIEDAVKRVSAEE
jgi:histidyl-tRNA synthetase